MILITKPLKEELTSKGFTNRIKISTAQTKQSLLNYGFTNHNKPTLYYVESVDRNTTFNLSVCLNTLEIRDIDVLNEDWLQSYDYQSEILSGKPSGKARNVYNKVNNILLKLQNDSIITGFDRGMYV
ncbi:hypothetical protein [Paenibacillus pini]|uniref:hypothetical protein n=1 Tax=Paenibacillus pini TaxID=669461 RepID=UPI00068FCBFF|nr:hypothetical protein [Paenibacillus pini]